MEVGEVFRVYSKDILIKGFVIFGTSSYEVFFKKKESKTWEVRPEV